MTEADFHYTSHVHDLESSAIAQKYGSPSTLLRRCPETLVLYRMRTSETVSVSLDPCSPLARSGFATTSSHEREARQFVRRLQ